MRYDTSEPPIKLTAYRHVDKFYAGEAKEIVFNILHDGFGCMDMPEVDMPQGSYNITPLATADEIAKVVFKDACGQIHTYAIEIEKMDAAVAENVCSSASESPCLTLSSYSSSYNSRRSSEEKAIYFVIFQDRRYVVDTNGMPEFVEAIEAAITHAEVRLPHAVSLSVAQHFMEHCQADGDMQVKHHGKSYMQIELQHPNDPCYVVIALGGTCFDSPNKATQTPFALSNVKIRSIVIHSQKVGEEAAPPTYSIFYAWFKLMRRVFMNYKRQDSRTRLSRAEFFQNGPCLSRLIAITSTNSLDELRVGRQDAQWMKVTNYDIQPARLTTVSNAIATLKLEKHTDWFKCFTGSDYFPQGSLWKLFVDIDLQHYGKNVYENEPDSLTRIIDTFLSVIPKYAGMPISMEMLTDVHDAVIEGVVKEDGRPFKKGTIFDVNEHYAYRFNIDNCTPEAKEEWTAEKLITTTRNEKGFVANHVKQVGQIQPILLSRAERLDRVNCGIQAMYEVTDDDNSNQRQKIEALCRCIRLIEISHIFPDANQRTLVNIIVNKLLLDLNLPPTVLKKNSMFDGYLSVREMANEIESGFARYFQLLDAVAPEQRMTDNCKHNEHKPVVSLSDLHTLEYENALMELRLLDDVELSEYCQLDDVKQCIQSLVTNLNTLTQFLIDISPEKISIILPILLGTHSDCRRFFDDANDLVSTLNCLDAEKTKVVVRIYNEYLPEIMRTFNCLVYSVSELPNKKFLIVCDQLKEYLPDLNPIGTKFHRLINERDENHENLLTLCAILTQHPGYVWDPDNLTSAFRCFNSQQKNDLRENLDFLKGQWCAIVQSSSLVALWKLFIYLNAEQRVYIYNEINDQIFELIRTVDDLNSRYIADEKTLSLCVALKGRWHALMLNKSIAKLEYLFKKLPNHHQHEIIDELSNHFHELVKDDYDFSFLARYITSDRLLSLCRTLTNSPGFSWSDSKLYEALVRFTSDQKVALCKVLKGRWRTILGSLHRLTLRLIRELPDDQQAEIAEELYNSPDMLITDSHLLSAFCEYLDGEIILSRCISLNQTCIFSWHYRDLTKVLSRLSSQQKKVLCDDMKGKWRKIEWGLLLDDIYRLFDQLDDKQRTTVFDETYDQIVKSARRFSDLLQLRVYVNGDSFFSSCICFTQRGNYYVSLSELKKIFSGFTSEQQISLCHALGNKWGEILSNTQTSSLRSLLATLHFEPKKRVIKNLAMLVKTKTEFELYLQCLTHEEKLLFCIALANQHQLLWSLLDDGAPVFSCLPSRQRVELCDALKGKWGAILSSSTVEKSLRASCLKSVFHQLKGMQTQIQEIVDEIRRDIDFSKNIKHGGDVSFICQHFLTTEEIIPFCANARRQLPKEEWMLRDLSSIFCALPEAKREALFQVFVGERSNIIGHPYAGIDLFSRLVKALPGESVQSRFACYELIFSMLTEKYKADFFDDTKQHLPSLVNHLDDLRGLLKLLLPAQITEVCNIINIPKFIYSGRRFNYIIALLSAEQISVLCATQILLLDGFTTTCKDLSVVTRRLSFKQTVAVYGAISDRLAYIPKTVDDFIEIYSYIPSEQIEIACQSQHKHLFALACKVQSYTSMPKEQKICLAQAIKVLLIQELLSYQRKKLSLSLPFLSNALKANGVQWLIDCLAENAEDASKKIRDELDNPKNSSTLFKKTLPGISALWTYYRCGYVATSLLCD